MMSRPILQFVTVSCVVSVAIATCFKRVPCPGASLIHELEGGEFGLDVSDAITQLQFECFKHCGYTFANVQAYTNLGQVDTHALSNILHAKVAGIEKIYVHMSPAVGLSTKSAAMQVTELVAALQEFKDTISYIWLDVEGSWSDSQVQNQQLFEDLLNQLQSNAPTLDVTVGVYTNEIQWTSIMGPTYTGGSSVKLWYPRYDGLPSFDDYVSFGGWDEPTMKQYRPSATVCGVNINENWSIDITE